MQPESSTAAVDPLAALAGGYFYAIQLDPDHAPRRIKLGWTQCIADRLKAHRTAAPQARVLWHWPCPREVEATAIAAITAGRGAALTREVFDFDDLNSLRSYADAFFAGVAALLPVTARSWPWRDLARRQRVFSSGIRQVRPGYFQGRVAVGGRRYSVAGSDRRIVEAKLAALRLRVLNLATAAASPLSDAAPT